MPWNYHLFDTQNFIQSKNTIKLEVSKFSIYYLQLSRAFWTQIDLIFVFRIFIHFTFFLLFSKIYTFHYFFIHLTKCIHFIFYTFDYRRSIIDPEKLSTSVPYFFYETPISKMDLNYTSVYQRTLRTHCLLDFQQCGAVRTSFWPIRTNLSTHVINRAKSNLI